MKIHVYDDNEKLAEGLAEWISVLINNTLHDQEYFSLVLSGGQTPKHLFRVLAKASWQQKIDWKRVHIFWGDERMVPFTDERNNAKSACDLLIDHLDIPAANIHLIRTDVEPLFAVKMYRELLHGFFDSSAKTFDLVLLGMGSDGHTLSVFPGSPLISDTRHWVNSVYLPDQQMYRITLMPTVVNQAANVAFMVEGASKASVLKEVIEGDRDENRLPAQLINPGQGETHWFLDTKAAADLSK